MVQGKGINGGEERRGVIDSDEVWFSMVKGNRRRGGRERRVGTGCTKAQQEVLFMGEFYLRQEYFFRHPGTGDISCASAILWAWVLGFACTVRGGGGGGGIRREREGRERLAFRCLF
jgi:hypothetical protein